MGAAPSPRQPGDLYGLAGMLAGAVAGALVGLLLAPDRGEKTRQMLAERARKQVEQGLERVTPPAN